MDDADQIGELIRLAGRRPMPVLVQMARARAVAREEWSRLYERRQWRRSAWVMTVATLAAAAGIILWFWTRPQPVTVARAEIAAIERVTGTLRVTSADRSTRSVSGAGAGIKAGDNLETGESGRAALLVAGLSIRLDRGTVVVLHDGTTLELKRGGVYVDTGAGRPGAGLRVITPLGSVRHLGTQFEVRLDGGAVRLRVRSGAIAIDAGGREWTSQAGEALLVAAGREPVRQAIAMSGPDWAWVSEIARPFQLEGSTVASFLDWASRETGARWQYDDPALQTRVSGIVLHGSIEGLLPDEALAAALPTCGLTSRRSGDRLIVSAARR